MDGIHRDKNTQRRTGIANVYTRRMLVREERVLEIEIGVGVSEAALPHSRLLGQCCHYPSVSLVRPNLKLRKILKKKYKLDVPVRRSALFSLIELDIPVRPMDAKGLRKKGMWGRSPHIKAPKFRLFLCLYSWLSRHFFHECLHIYAPIFNTNKHFLT